MTRWTAVLFMVGSACFAVASIPAITTVVPAELVGVTYFVGSIFFTSAGALVSIAAWGDARRAVGGRLGRALVDRDWLAAIIQSVGTVWFNLNTFDAMQGTFSAQEENLLVWTPDFLGSICFLVSSGLSWWSACGGPWRVRRDSNDWWMAALNLVGSGFFMVSAIAAYTLPDTDELLDASLATSGTLLGALCFFWGAHLLLVGSPDPDGDGYPAAS
ncbi:MAG: hypothetical protein MUF83_05025 [Acidimicrobiales bacterium]|jgi:hypothetical protein|nr:hypothetical protein [Acidimicrobiales bacterium]